MLLVRFRHAVQTKSKYIASGVPCADMKLELCDIKDILYVPMRLATPTYPALKQRFIFLICYVGVLVQDGAIKAPLHSYYRI